jgi:hypothetical protein
MTMLVAGLLPEVLHDTVAQSAIAAMNAAGVSQSA